MVTALSSGSEIFQSLIHCLGLSFSTDESLCLPPDKGKVQK